MHTEKHSGGKSAQKNIAILGISAYYHDSAAALVIDGDIVAAAHEERFTRKKHDDSFPSNAIEYVLGEYGLSVYDLDAIVFYDKPFIKFERLLETYHVQAPRGVLSFATAMPVWVKDKLFMKNNLHRHLHEVARMQQGRMIPNKANPLPKKDPVLPQLLFAEHHLSHGASAFYPSPFQEAAILTVDGVGEWATTTISHGKGAQITLLKEMHFPHSLGMLYSACTYYCGFKVNSGEYKLMGLAPYGNKGSAAVEKMKQTLLDKVISLKEDGSILMNMDYFEYSTGLKMCNDAKWQEAFGFCPRKAESELTQEYMDMALAIQEVTEQALVRLARTAQKLTGAQHLVMAGGVALNCVANEKIRDAGIFKDVWVQPAAGDAGGALGAALAGHYIFLGNATRSVAQDGQDAMHGSYLGSEYSELDVLRMARSFGAVFKQYDNVDKTAAEAALRISRGEVVGWFQGRMEWGPRSLGNRSIIGDPRDPAMQKKLNLKIKYREGFRPFAPAVLEEDVADYFETTVPSPYMLFTAPVKKNRRKPLAPVTLSLGERLYTPRSDIPSITHLDYSARLQTVSQKTNKPFHTLIAEFKKLTGYGVVVNTSFNVRNEPIVRTPEDAYRCFMNTEMDTLVIGNFVFSKKDQPTWHKPDIAQTYGLD
jgi:carbamoyltransferase